MSSGGRNGLRVVLLVVVVVGAVALYLDVRGRASSNEANDRLGEVDLENPPGQADIADLMQREPTSISDVEGGRIEFYKYASALPWRSYSIQVAYAENADQQMRYVDHNLNHPEGELRLAQVIAAHRYRLLNPAAEEEEEIAGPVEVSINDVYRGIQEGARLVLAYDTEKQTFSGTVENTTRDIMLRVDVRVELSNGKELGPATVGELDPGSGSPVELKTVDSDFESWTAYAEPEGQ